MVLFKMASVTVCHGLLFALRTLSFFLDKRIFGCYISRKQGANRKGMQRLRLQTGQSL
jgi:hypothetical protein